MRLTLSLLARYGKWSKKYSNLPDSYIKRASEQVYWETPRGKPQYLRAKHERKHFRYSVHRPWTQEFYDDNCYGKPTFIHTEPLKEWSFFRGDRVEVLVGPDKGKQGIVKIIIEERNWVIVEGLNMKLRCIGKTKSFPGIYVQEEQPLLVTEEIALVDPIDRKGTAIEWRYTETGEYVRVSSRSGRIIPIPVESKETIDYKLPSLYKEGVKDTLKEDVEKITFKPELKTFEMDIMEKMDIKEDRVAKPSYWY